LNISYSVQLTSRNRRDSAGILHSKCFGSLAGNIAGCAVLVFGFTDPATSSIKSLFFISMLILIGLRLSDALFWQFKLKDTEFNGLLAVRRFILGSLMTACFWSAYCVLVFDHVDIVELAVTLIIISGLAGGASTVLAGHKNTASAFVAIILFPFAFYALVSDQNHHQLLGMLAGLFGVVLFFGARKSAGFTTSTIELKNENAQLIKQMQVEKQEIGKVNAELNNAYSKLNIANNSLEEEVLKRTEKIAQLSNIDALTGLYNRSAFTSQLKTLISRSAKRDNPLALLFIDLNGFKKINDTLGHKVGDAVLAEIAHRLGAFANDYHAGRWGGDEFLIALPYAGEEAAVSVANALQTRIGQPVDVMSNQLSLTASVGIAMFPEHSTDELELIQLADFAMFEQKRAAAPEPRVFTQDLYQNLKGMQNLRDGLLHAINKRQFFVCYQPIICCKTGAPWAFEALIRWDFDGTLVSPDTFIPLAEQSGFIKDIGAWVLNRACIDASQWQFAKDACVSVNVSVMQLLDDDFIKILDKALLTSGLAPERLHLEITESMFADNKKRVREQLVAMNDRNIQVSIDDFGTGYSTLSQLQTLQFDTVKIDKSFVQNIEHGGEAIIRATLFIAREFGSQTVAEGIETQEQATALRDLGVDYLQGYLYSKPIRNDLLSQWLNEQTANSPTQALVV
jgi:diguanylate cyclase (GGDEF)-like protein